MARLTFISDTGEPMEVVFGPDAPEVFVGRNRDCQIRTSNQSVSRKHSRIFYDGTAYWLMDLGSSNGTYHQQRRLQPQTPSMLQDNELFVCGNFEVKFEFDDADYAQQGQGDYYGDAGPDEATAFADSVSAPAYPPPGQPPARQEDDDWNIPAPPSGPAPSSLPPIGEAGYDPNAYDPNAYDPNAYDQQGYDPNAYDPNAYDQQGFDAGAAPATLESPAGTGPADQGALDAANAAIADRDAAIAERDTLIADKDAQIAQRDGQIADRNQQIEALRGEVESLKKRLGELGALETKAQDLEARIRELEAQIRTLELDNQNLKTGATDSAPLRAEIDRLSIEAEQVRAASNAELERMSRALADTQAALETARRTPPAVVTQPVDDPRVPKLEAELTEIRHALSEAEKRAASSEAELRGIRETVNEARAARKTAEDMVSMVRRNLDHAEAELGPLKDRIARYEAEGRTRPPTGPVPEVTAVPTGVDPALLEAERAARVDAERATAAARAESAQATAAAQAAQAQVDAARAEAEQARGALESLRSAAASGSDQSASLERQLAAQRDEVSTLNARLAEAQAAAAQASQAASELAALRDQLAAADKAAAAAAERASKAEAAAAAAPPAAAVDDEKHRQLELAKEELELSNRANLKRINTLLADLAKAREAAEEAESRARAAEAKAAATPSAAPAAAPPSPSLTRFAPLVEDVNGQISAFRSDFEMVADAYGRLNAEADDERLEAMETMAEYIESCRTRSEELKRSLRGLRLAVEGHA